MTSDIVRAWYVVHGFVHAVNLAGHIDDSVCVCARCRPEWHTGVRCTCQLCETWRRSMTEGSKP